MMLPRHLRTVLCATALAFVAAAPAHAQLTIDMTRPSFEPVPIAIVDFGGDRVGAEMATVIRNDLQNSGCSVRFRPAPSFSRTSTPTPRRASPTGGASARPASWSAK